MIALVALFAGCGSDTIASSSESTDTASVSAAAPAATGSTEPAPADTETNQPAAAPAPADTETNQPAEDPAPADTETNQPTEDPEPTPTTEIPEFTPPTGIEPDRIVIESIGVDAPVIDLSLSGELPEVPTDFDDTGWYTQTRLPGEIGPAVIAGHIDSRSGPAVFAELDQLQPGDRIEVAGSSGETRMFEVVDSAQYPKGDLPDEVFGFGGPEPELRLITCGGTFDPDAGHYRDNFIVFATAVDTDETGA